jgi:hypothetical protein
VLEKTRNCTAQLKKPLNTNRSRKSPEKEMSHAVAQIVIGALALSWGLSKYPKVSWRTAVTSSNEMADYFPSISYDRLWYLGMHASITLI